MNLTALILGSAATAATKTRGVSATLIGAGPDRILVDCGEGTARQLLRSGAGLGSIGTILITHGHADHYLGLPGLLKTWAARGRTEPLLIAGTPGTWQLIGSMQGFIGPMPYDIRILEPEPGEAVPLPGTAHTLRAVRTEHRILSYGWAFEEADGPATFDRARADAERIPNGPERGALAGGHTITLPDGRVICGADYLLAPRAGRRIVCSGDTRPDRRLRDLADGADLLIHEATFLTGDVALARQAGHSTAAEAAEVARDAQVRALVLNHLSSRYAAGDVAAEAKSVFASAFVADDFDMFSVPHRDRGPITHTNTGGDA